MEQTAELKQKVFDNFFSIKGRLRRKHYFLRLLLLIIIAAILIVLMSPNGVEDNSKSIVQLIASLFVIPQAVKRAHDINHPGWYSLLFLFFIPLIGSILVLVLSDEISYIWFSLIGMISLVYGLVLLFKDGTPGPNKYGDDPKNRLGKGEII